jgi:methylphosphotriester-DNA--protein-cysteine methyltransferase
MKAKDIREADAILSQNIKSIRTVTEWANFMGYHDISFFSRRYRNHHNYKAVKRMTKIRMKQIELLMSTNQAILNYELARMVGLRDEQDLYNFVSYHRGCSPTKLKKELTSLP